jgi:cell division protein FtsI/penicillin-binding protein 2
MLTVMSAIANGGTAQTPYLVSSITSPEGKTVFSAKENMTGEYFTPDVAKKVDEMLRSNVKNQYGDGFFPKMSFCGKTGTAEVSNDKNIRPNALFVGYSQLDEMPFAIIVVVEDTTTSITSAVPIASKVMKAVKSEYVK